MEDSPRENPLLLARFMLRLYSAATGSASWLRRRATYAVDSILRCEQGFRRLHGRKTDISHLSSVYQGTRLAIMSDQRGVENRPLRLLSLGMVFIFVITHVLIISIDGGGIRGYSE
jgi:hypothetical protein